MPIDVETRLIETEQRSKTNAHRLDKVESKLEDITDIVTSIKVLSQKQETMDGDLQEIKKDVKTLTEKPAKRWDAIVGAILAAVVGGIIGFVLFKLGLG